MIGRIEEYIEENRLIEAGDGIAAGISGGADSVCLLRVLCALREKWNLRILAVHVNHGLRGEEADRDEEFTRELCGRLSVEFTAVHEDIAQMAEDQGISEEDAGRRARYRAFAEECRKRGWKKAAVAHNLEDNAETVLFHLFRGSSLNGLTGMRPARILDRGNGIWVIRPLLSTGREEIEQYLGKLGQDYCTDRTNSSEEYTRNLIRHVILKEAKEKVNRKSAEHIVQAASMLGQIGDYFREAAAEISKRFIRQEDGGIWIEEGLAREKRILACEVLLDAVEQACGSRKDIASVHVNDLFSLFGRQTGRRLELPGGLLAYRRRGGILLKLQEKKDGETGKKIGTEPGDGEVVMLPGAITVPGEWYLDELKCFLRIEIADYEKNIIIPKNNYTKWFDYDKIKGTLALRTRKERDFLMIRENGGTKTIKALMIETHIPAEKRDRIPLLAAGSHVLWMIGGRGSEAFRIGENTKKILKVYLYGGYGYGGQN